MTHQKEHPKDYCFGEPIEESVYRLERYIQNWIEYTELYLNGKQICRAWLPVYRNPTTMDYRSYKDKLRKAVNRVANAPSIRKELWRLIKI